MVNANVAVCAGYDFGLYLNFCPPTAAWYIKPPLATVNTAMPLR